MRSPLWLLFRRIANKGRRDLARSSTNPQLTPVVAVESLQLEAGVNGIRIRPRAPNQRSVPMDGKCSLSSHSAVLPFQEEL